MSFLERRCPVPLWVVSTLGAAACGWVIDFPARAAWAQSVTGALEGRVLDAAGAPLQASVVTGGPSLQGRRGSITDARGRFRLEPLPVGRYDVMVSAIGQRTVLLRDVQVRLGVVSDLGDVRLEVEAIPLPGDSVEAVRPAARRAPTAVGGSLTRAELRALPTDRDYLSVVALLPHADVSYFGDRLNLVGTTGAETDFHVDGMRLNEPPGNAVSTSLPYNLVEEVQVLAGGYDAEHGGAGGGIVNAVTRPGGNEFRGQAFAFVADRALTTASGGPTVSPNTRQHRSWDGGASASLPLVRDRLALSLAWNPAFEREDIALPGFGIEPDTRTVQRFATGLSWRASNATTVSLSGVGDPSRRDQVGGTVLPRARALASLDPVLTRRRGGGWGSSARVLHVLGPRAYFEVRGSLTRSEYSDQPATATGASEPLYIDETGSVEGGTGRAVDRNAGRSSASGTFAGQWRAHVWKAGASYEDAFFDERLRVSEITRLSPTAYTHLTLAGWRTANHTRVPAVFVQDAWTVAEGVRLTGGLRWTRELWMTSAGDLGQRVADAWQPRLGLTWQPVAAWAPSLFASAGRFHQQTRLNVPGVFLQDVPGEYLVRTYNHDPRLDPSGADTSVYIVFNRQPAVDNLRAAAFDEIQVGAERRWGALHASVRALHREQRSGIVGVASPVSGRPVYGNPGRGELAAYPEIERTYRAFEVTVSAATAALGATSASYVWSELRGNYEGYWDQSVGQNDPLGGGSFMADPRFAGPTRGLLPGDRTHRFKCRASRALGRGVAVGTTFVWTSGTPLSAFTPTPYGAPYHRFLEPRGSRGRSPSLYDWNVRLAFEPPGWKSATRPRVLADAYHLGNPRRAVFVDQLRYLGVGSFGQPVAPNPNFLEPLLYQPPVAFRFGVEVDW